MSDQEQAKVEQESSPPEQAKSISPNFRKAIFMLFGILVVAIVWMVGSIRTNNAKINGIKETSSIIAVTVREPILKKEAGRLRLIATDIAAAGNFASVTFTDAKGVVIASTDRLLQSETLKHLEKPPLNPEIKKIQGQETVYRAITLGQDNVIGGVSIILKP